MDNIWPLAEDLVYSVNTFVVHNILDSCLCLAAVSVILLCHRFQDADARIRLLILPVIVPIGALLIHNLIHSHDIMVMVNLHQILNLQVLLAHSPGSKALVALLFLGILLVSVFLSAKGAFTIYALWRLPQLYHRIMPGDFPRLDAILDRLLAEAHYPRPTVLLEEGSARFACAFGLLRPSLLISRGFLDQPDDDFLEAVLAHEVAHLARHDDWLNFLLLTLRNMLFFNPIVHFLSKKIIQEQEVASDSLAVRLTGKPLTYVESLLHFYHATYGKPTLRPAKNTLFANRRGELEERILGLLYARETPESPLRCRLVTGGILIGLVAGLFLVC